MRRQFYSLTGMRISFVSPLFFCTLAVSPQVSYLTPRGLSTHQEKINCKYAPYLHVKLSPSLFIILDFYLPFLFAQSFVFPNQRPHVFLIEPVH